MAHDDVCIGLVISILVDAPNATKVCSFNNKLSPSNFSSIVALQRLVICPQGWPDIYREHLKSDNPRKVYETK